MEQELQKLGFNISESKVYIELLKEGNLSAGQISKKTGLNRRTAYDTVARLEEKGIIAHNITNNKQSFFAVEPEIILNKIDEMKKSALDILPALKSLKVTSEAESEVYTYKGREGIMNILRMILKSKEYVSFGSGKEFPEVMQHYYYQFQKQKEELKIKSKTILGSQLKKSNIITTVSKASEVKFLSETLTGSSSTFIFDNKVVIFIWQKPYWGIIIESKEVNKSYSEYFKELWKIART
jgi:sugar-specific transcriptional regulator TrmB